MKTSRGHFQIDHTLSILNNHFILYQDTQPGSHNAGKKRQTKCSISSCITKEMIKQIEGVDFRPLHLSTYTQEDYKINSLD